MFTFAQGLMPDSLYNRLSENEKRLYDDVRKSDSLRMLRVNNYLSQNTDVDNVYYKDNRVFVLYDIIDSEPIYKSTDNADAAEATKTDLLHPGGSLGLNLDGTGITVGVWDGGPVQDDHPEFGDSSGASRVFVVQPTDNAGNNQDNAHGTHVAGTIAANGTDPDAKGMAPNANIRSYNFSNDTPEMVTEASNPTNPIILSNHSYGVSVSQGNGTISTWIMGAYNDSAREIDDISRTYPKYLMVASSGNSGGVNYADAMYQGFDKLTGDKNAKNNLVVANANPSINPFNGEVSLTINPNSSQGPTDDLRIKPEITADGTGLYSPVPTNAYNTFSGTSMSAPNTTGTIALLQQYYEQLNGEYMNSSTVKALVCHTATDDDNRIGPDPIFGWGFLNAEFAANTITNDDTGSALIEENTLNNNQNYTLLFNADAGDDIVATICWTDVPGESVSGNSNLNNQTPRLVNDLDIRITKDATTFFPWKLDLTSSGFSNSKADNSVDNLERIDIEAPVAGTYTLTVSHKGTLESSNPFDNNPSQDYALILTGSNITLSLDEINMSNIQIYPNPVSDILNIENLPNTNYSYELFDIQGKLVRTGELNTVSSKINLQEFSKGIYLMRISNGETFVTKKIIKK